MSHLSRNIRHEMLSYYPVASGFPTQPQEE